MRAVHCCSGDTYTRLSQRDYDTGGPACRRTGAILQATEQGTSSTCQRQCQPTPRTAGIESGPSTNERGGKHR